MAIRKRVKMSSFTMISASFSKVLVKAFCLSLLATFFLTSEAADVKILSQGVTNLIMKYTTTGLDVELMLDNESKLKGTMGVGYDFSNISLLDFSITVTNWDNGFRVEMTSNNLSLEVRDCYDLQKGTLNWYGGPQIYQQEWPIEKLQLSGDDPYVVRKDANFAVPERYWLSSNGVVVYVDERSPLYVDQNVLEDGKVCFIAKNQGPYIGRKRLYNLYYLMAFDDPVSAHRSVAKSLFPQPTAYPNVKMIEEPIWTTWAKYKREITDNMVREFAYDILDQGFRGQIEIDNNWETCYGSRIFLPDKFGNITAVAKDLQSKGFRVTLWTAPFVNSDCKDVATEGETNGYFVKNPSGNMTTVWWEGNDARQIDFTNPEARSWYSEKLEKLYEDPGIDGLKFDAGETDYVAQPAVYESEDPELVPNIFTQKYIETVAQFGDYIEARSAFRTQNYSFFLRMIDKDSLWGLDDGLQSLVTTLLQLNMVGYSFILPDMIGGNGYRAQPTLELLIRWTQATVFMPALQFSYLPWDFSDDKDLNGTEIIKAMVKLHEKYSPDIVEAMKATVSSQVPTNPPIWWIAPKDPIALATYDEFLLGEKILVAPVMEEGAWSRSVYLPSGTWLDGNDESTTYTGPINFTYSAPLSVLPYFIKQNDYIFSD